LLLKLSPQLVAMPLMSVSGPREKLLRGALPANCLAGRA